MIATGTSSRQMRRLPTRFPRPAANGDFKRFGRAGYDQGRWILLDFVDVVVHLFDQEYREYYDLELLWGDAKRIVY